MKRSEGGRERRKADGKEGGKEAGRKGEEKLQEV